MTHRTVPVEPTREMQRAFDRAHLDAVGGSDDPFDWFAAGYEAALSAAPPVQMEAVAYRIKWPGKYTQQERLVHAAGQPGFGLCDNKALAEARRDQGAKVTPLYASPVPPPVQQEAVHRIVGLEPDPNSTSGYRIRVDTSQWSPEQIEAIKAEMRKPGGVIFASPVPSSERDDIIEMCAKVAEEFDFCQWHGNAMKIISGQNAPDYIASSIRSLKSPAQSQEGTT